jgi:ribosomal protein S18 acetylase RimI-like enzyme
VTGSAGRVRTATATDLDLLEAIVATDLQGSWTRLGLATELLVAGAHVEVVERDGTLVALMVWRHAAGEIELLDIVTHSAHRRQGHARRLMQHLVAQANSLAVPRIMLEVRRGNRAARTLYEATGFVVVGVRARYYADQEDAILMDRRP